MISARGGAEGRGATPGQKRIGFEPQRGDLKTLGDVRVMGLEFEGFRPPFQGSEYGFETWGCTSFLGSAPG